MPASAFIPRDSDTKYDYASVGYIYLTAGSESLWAPVHLQNSVYLHGMRAYYYDSSSMDIQFSFTRYYELPSQYFENIATGFSSGTSGYGNVWIPINHTIYLRHETNGDQFYVINVFFNENGLNQRFKGVRLFYSLQVSPAPNIATFTDVPTNHMFFQFIEALADSGITTGCTATEFCPNQYVTRGQMAVFLAKALGLHWSY